MRHRRVARTLGAILRLFSIFLLVPALGSLVWDSSVEPLGWAGPLKPTGLSFLLTGLFTFLLGALMGAWGKPSPDEELREREAFFIVAFGWILIAAIGSMPFLLTRATSNPTVALFESMSALTTTGYSALNLPLEQYPESIHLWRGTLHFFGGMGIVVILVAILARLTEGAVKLFGGESTGEVTRIRPKLTQTAKALFGVFVGLNAVAFIGFVLAFRYTGAMLTWKEAVYHAMVHAAAGVATGGMSTRSDNIGAFQSDAVAIVAMVAMFMGGISVPLYYRLLHGEWWALAHNAEFRFYLFMIVAPALLSIGIFLFNGFDLHFSLMNGFFGVITTLVGCGFALASPQPFPDGVKLLMLFLMFTGGMLGSTTGALKLHRILILLRMGVSELTRLLHPHAVSVVKVGGRILPEDAQRRIVVLFFSYVSTFIAGAIGLAMTGMDLETSLVASAASLGGVGYGWGGVLNGFGEPVTGLARLIGTTLMWMGRLEIFAALLIFVPATYRD